MSFLILSMTALIEAWSGNLNRGPGKIQAEQVAMLRVSAPYEHLDDEVRYVTSASGYISVAYRDPRWPAVRRHCQ